MKVFKSEVAVAYIKLISSPAGRSSVELDSVELQLVELLVLVNFGVVLMNYYLTLVVVSE